MRAPLPGLEPEIRSRLNSIIYTMLRILAHIGLVLTLLPSLLYLADIIDLSGAKWLMMVGSILWMGMAPVVQKQNRENKKQIHINV